MQKTTRLDVLIHERGLVPSRQAAQAAIMDGGVLVDGQKVTKPGTPIKAESKVELTGEWASAKFVSRGGLKLERALDVFHVDVTGRICLDLGASTGGFTDCLLKRGAAQVYAIDVGYGQLDWSLRQDPRVVVKERINARHLTADQLYAQGSPIADLAVADLSFISLLKVLPAALDLLQKDNSQIVALVKPQFEAGRQAVGKGGVVRDAATHIAVLQNVVEEAAKLSLHIQQITYSPVKGPAGNIEFLALWSTSSATKELDIAKIVDDAHSQLSTAK